MMFPSYPFHNDALVRSEKAPASSRHGAACFEHAPAPLLQHFMQDFLLLAKSELHLSFAPEPLQVTFHP